VDSDIQIEGGTSGGPVINEKGELLGVVSTSSIIHEQNEKSTGQIPRPHLALPLWIYKEITQFE
jgi:V8-like Glu-specific endopeptidase